MHSKLIYVHLNEPVHAWHVTYAQIVWMAQAFYAACGFQSKNSEF